MWKFPPASIVVAVDFGEASAHAMRLAGALAAAYGASLTAVHVESLEAPPYFTPQQTETLEAGRTRAREKAQSDLAEFVRDLTEHPATLELQDGPPAAAILDAAAAADLLVVGTHGRRGPSRWWLGSVAETVIQAAVCPLLVVPASTRVISPAGAFERPIVVSDDTTFYGDAQRYGRGLADTFGGELKEAFGTGLQEAIAAGATLVVVPLADPHHPGHAREITLRLVRGSPLPILFVPGRA